jgi:adenylate cyclase
VATTRRLVVIMFTDMVGYSAAAQTDEKSTLALREEQEELVRSILAAHQGREVKSTGDGFLIEFESALKATECAVGIQRRIHERNLKSGIPPIRLRIGIHLGDVEQRGADIFGDAVNIAARIEPVAEPGGICISGAVYEQVRNKIPDRLEKLPPTALKGLQSPIDLYRVALPWTARESPLHRTGPAGIAILPFTNISPDPKDEYFADGLTEELISVLSRLRDLRVISRTSVMLYKATPKSASQIGAELGVGSLLEGSVRKAGSRLRITAQLIDARSDQHVWAKTFDRELDDIFAVQAEIATEVAAALQAELRPPEKARIEGRPPVRSESYLAYLRGRTQMRSRTRDSLEAAKGQFELAISIDDRNAAAHARLADVTRQLGHHHAGAASTWDETRRRHAKRAIELDPNLAEAHATLATTLMDDFDYVQAEKEFKVAFELNPSDSLTHFQYAICLEAEGRGDDALQEYDLAQAADPLWPMNLAFSAELLIWLGRPDEALARIQKIGELEPDGVRYHGGLADYFIAKSEIEKALSEIRRVEELETETGIDWLTRAWYLVTAGKKEEARALLRSHETSSEMLYTPLNVALFYAQLGDLDDFIRLSEKAIELHAFNAERILIDRRLEHARNDPRFQALLQKVNLA